MHGVGERLNNSDMHARIGNSSCAPVAIIGFSLVVPNLGAPHQRSTLK